MTAVGQSIAAKICFWRAITNTGGLITLRESHDLTSDELKCPLHGNCVDRGAPGFESYDGGFV